MPTTDDEIQEKYLERAIRELNQLTHRLQECSHCPRGNLMPVLGSGHPQADIMLLKYAPTAAEIEEGVAFYGRSGNALMKSFKRLGIDPLAVYGTLCVKCPVSDPALAGGECVERIVEEIAIVQPRCIVVMGERALETLNEVEVPLAGSLEPTLGEIQGLTPTIDVALRSRHRRLARLGGAEAGVLDGVPRARRLVLGPAAVLGRRGLGHGGHRLDVAAREPANHGDVERLVGAEQPLRLFAISRGDADRALGLAEPVEVVAVAVVEVAVKRLLLGESLARRRRRPPSARSRAPAAARGRTSAAPDSTLSRG